MVGSAALRRLFGGYFSCKIVGADPHIGHLYSALLADAIQRWQKASHSISLY
jgi:hypothetical protein